MIYNGRTRLLMLSDTAALVHFIMGGTILKATVKLVSLLLVRIDPRGICSHQPCV